MRWVCNTCGLMAEFGHEHGVPIPPAPLPSLDGLKLPTQDMPAKPPAAAHREIAGVMRQSAPYVYELTADGVKITLALSPDVWAPRARVNEMEAILREAVELPRWHHPTEEWKEHARAVLMKGEEE